MNPLSLISSVGKTVGSVGKVVKIGSSILKPSDAEISYGVQDQLPEEVTQVIERSAPRNVARVDYKESSKFGQRYKCYDDRGVFMGRVKCRHGSWRWEDA